MREADLDFHRLRLQATTCPLWDLAASILHDAVGKIKGSSSRSGVTKSLGSRPRSGVHLGKRIVDYLRVPRPCLLPCLFARRGTCTQTATKSLAMLLRARVAQPHRLATKTRVHVHDDQMCRLCRDMESPGIQLMLMTSRITAEHRQLNTHRQGSHLDHGTRHETCQAACGF